MTVVTWWVTVMTDETFVTVVTAVPAVTVADSGTVAVVAVLTSGDSGDRRRQCRLVTGKHPFSPTGNSKICGKIFCGRVYVLC